MFSLGWQGSGTSQLTPVLVTDSEAQCWNSPLCDHFMSAQRETNQSAYAK